MSDASVREHRALAWILGGGLLLRLLHLWAVHDQPFVAQLVEDSQEYDRWARTIVAGDWLGHGAFFQAPLYPYFLAAVYAVCAGRTLAAYLTQIVLAVSGLYALYRAGTLALDHRLGLIAAALLATYPVGIFYDVQVGKESLAVTSACFLLWALLAAGRDGRVRTWLLAGVCCGVLALLRENVLLAVPFLSILTLRPAASTGQRTARAAAFLGGVLLLLSPVAVRNGVLGGSFLPTTFQGGVNFYIGNNEHADGTYRPVAPGHESPAEERAGAVRIAAQAEGRTLSPGEVSRYWLARALDWARAHPIDFLRLQLRKLRLFWSWYEWPDAVDYYYLQSLSPVLRLPGLEFGGLTILATVGVLLLRRGAGAFMPVLLYLAVFVLTTVTFFLFSRYRLPAVPALLLLAALPLHRLMHAIRTRRLRETTGWSALLVLALALPRLTGYEPRMDLVHYNLGRIHDEASDSMAAERDYRAALADNPNFLQACINLGNHAARARRYQEARGWFERAVAIEPDSDDAHANLGGVYLALGDLPRAEAELRTTLILNPQNAAALHNLEVLRRRPRSLP